jgi:phosphohistidine swiveling domain-containing protein
MLDRLRKKEEYVEAVRRKVPPFWLSAFFDGYQGKYFEELIGEPKNIRNVVVSDHRIYYLKKDLDDFAQITFDRFHQDPDRLKRLRKTLDTREDKMMKATTKDVASFVQALESFVPALVIGFIMQDILLDEVDKKLKDKLSVSDAEAMIDGLNSPLEDNFYRKAELDLAKSGVTDKHLEEYAWINSRYGVVNRYTTKDAEERLEGVDRDEFLQEYENQKKTTEKVVQESKNILGEDSHLVDLMQFLVFYRTHRTEALNRAIFHAVPLVEDFARRKGMTYDEILHCTTAEVLGDGDLRDINLKDRIKGYSFFADEEGSHVLSGSDDEKIKEFFKNDIEETSEIKGSVACPGNVIGKARIILSQEDFSKFEEGDVLVAPMTTPDYVPIMKQAVAFVTDEGGITCHAAIVSREMKKPCIIGTKIATQVLKDGDLVEVDANKGVVKILEK